MTKKTSATKSSTRREEMEIFVDDIRYKYVPDMDCCLWLLDALPYWFTAELIFAVTETIRGYSKSMAKVIVFNVINFSTGGGRRLTAIDHVDLQLLELYSRISNFAKENGEKLEPMF